VLRQDETYNGTNHGDNDTFKDFHVEVKAPREKFDRDSAKRLLYTVTEKDAGAQANRWATGKVTLESQERL
jgi:hypothetical protein